MRRVAVIGCGGAGKSTVARALALHTDRDAWVIDAMKLSLLEHRLQRADTVVFVDTARRSCFLGVVRRDGLRALRNHEFMHWIWDFPRKSRPRIYELLERYGGDTRVVVLRSRREVRGFLATLRRDGAVVG